MPQTPSPNGGSFNVVANGPYELIDCRQPDAVCSLPCNGYQITGPGSPAEGPPLGLNGIFTTLECAEPDDTAGVNHVDGNAIMTDANGDQIFLHYVATTPPPDFVLGTFHEDGTFEITGGTGRFEGATGSGQFSTDGTLQPQVVKATWTGTIRLGVKVAAGF